MLVDILTAAGLGAVAAAIIAYVLNSRKAAADRKTSLLAEALVHFEAVVSAIQLAIQTKTPPDAEAEKHWEELSRVVTLYGEKSDFRGAILWQTYKNLGWMLGEVRSHVWLASATPDEKESVLRTARHNEAMFSRLLLGVRGGLRLNTIIWMRKKRLAKAYNDASLTYAAQKAVNRALRKDEHVLRHLMKEAQRYKRGRRRRTRIHPYQRYRMLLNYVTLAVHHCTDLHMNPASDWRFAGIHALQRDGSIALPPAMDAAGITSGHPPLGIPYGVPMPLMELVQSEISRRYGDLVLSYAYFIGDSFSVLFDLDEELLQKWDLKATRGISRGGSREIVFTQAVGQYDATELYIKFSEHDEHSYFGFFKFELARHTPSKRYREYLSAPQVDTEPVQPVSPGESAAG